jgi:putative hydrolase of HD superfamily
MNQEDAYPAAGHDRVEVAPADAAVVGLVRFLHRAGRLKATPRTGWLDRGVPADETESVADHSFRVALLAWLAARLAAAGDPALDVDRVLALALIHDLAEALTGDLPPYDPAAIPVADAAARRAFLDGHHVRDPERTAAKRAAEAAAMADLLADLPPSLAASLDRLWTELQWAETAEARFVKQADKLETYLQSREYLAADPTRPMASFASEVAAQIDDPTLAALRNAIADESVEGPR